MVKKPLYLLPLLLVVLLLCACGENYSGKGNDFTMQATIYRIGALSVTVQNITMESAEGKAIHWFDGNGDDGKGHQIHNNYNTCDWHSRHVIGHVFDRYGNEIQLRDLHVGERVTIEGKIRSNASSCGKTSSFNSRPVFDRLIVVKR